MSGNVITSETDDASPDAPLVDAINSAGLARLRIVLHQICKDLRDAKNSARSMLLIEDEQMNTNGKRKLPTQRFEVCEQCKQEFDVLKNSDKACNWHPDLLEIDWDGDEWADHEEECHGPIDTEENHKEFPEGFIWQCCDKRADAKGCTVGPHKIDVKKRSKR